MALLCLAALSSAARAATITARYSLSSTLLPNGNIVAAGGFGAGDVAVPMVEIIQVVGGNVVPAMSMSVARASHTATLLPNGLILVAGGVNNVGAILPTTELYNPNTNMWSPGPPMNQPRHSHTATLLPNGRVLLAGGQNGAASVTNSYDLYDPATGLITPGSGVLSDARAGHSASLLPNGRVFIAGGYAFPLSYFVTTEIYNPITDLTTPGPALIAKRAFHTATQMGNQNVLIAGGYNARDILANVGFLNDTEIYNPVANSISPGAGMLERRMFHSAALNPSGLVNINGGLGNITTSYFHAAPTFDGIPLSILRVGAPSINPATGTIQGTSNLYVTISPTLSVKDSNGRGPTGIVDDGQVAFSSAIVQTNDAFIEFIPNATASIAGFLVKNGQINPPQQVHFSPPSGTVIGTTVTLPANGLLTFVSPAGSGTRICFTPTPLNAGGSPPPPPGIIGNDPGNNCPGPNFSTLHANLTVTFPSQYAGLPVIPTIIRGQARIKSGSIVITAQGAVAGFTINLTGGFANLTGAGCTIPVDASGVPFLSCTNLTFNNLAGSVIATNATTTSPITDNNAEGIHDQPISGMNLELLYVADTMNLSGQQFRFDVATVTIRSMAFADQERYDPVKNTFVFGVPTSSPTFQAPKVLATNGDEVILAGRNCSGFYPLLCQPFQPNPGYVPYIRVPAGAGWTGVGNLLHGRANHSLTVLQDGSVLAAGGTDGPTVLTSCELYNPIAQLWSQTGALNTPRNLHTATLLTNGNVLAAGGFSTTSSTSELQTAEIFINASKLWSFVAPMASSRTFHSAALMDDGNVLVTGGFGNNQYIQTAEIFYSTAFRWFPTANPMPVARALHTTTLLKDGRVMVAGGVNGVNGVLGDVRAYNPTTLSWDLLPSMNVPRHSHTATLLQDGKVLVAGGDDGFGEIGEAEIYDPLGNTWTLTTNFPVAGAGNDMLQPRLKHTALLLPDGKVIVTGGVKADGTALDITEGFDVEFSTWQSQGTSTSKRGYHGSVVLNDGNMLTAGGFDGINYLANAENQLFGGVYDSPGPSQRAPQITALDTGTVLNNGTEISVLGFRLRGVTEASGGGAASANASFHHPRVYLQRLDGAGGTGQSSSPFMIDVTSQVYYGAGNLWSNMDSSITVALPNLANQLPFGLYSLRVAANAQFSPATLLQVGPIRPSSVIQSVPSGFLSGPSSVTWTWQAALPPGGFDGYTVYSAINGVFLGTAPVTSPTVTFVQQNLGPDSVSLISVSPFNISGDGPVVVATSPVNTQSSVINGLTGSGGCTPTPVGCQPTTFINWTWNPVVGASSYQVFSATSGQQLGSPAGASFIETGLSTNTAYGVRVRAIVPAGAGQLSNPATAFTLAAPPLTTVPGALIQVSTSSFLATWQGNTNPPNTTYTVQVIRVIDGASGSQSGIAITSFTVIGLSPNVIYAASVTAVNGNGIANGAPPANFTNLGSTCTLANPPANAQVINVTPNSITVSWSANGNSPQTIYQVVASSNDFVTVSTPVPFSSNFTGLQATVGGLLTGTTYKFQISAQNQFGQPTAFATPVPAGTTGTGGGPPGSLSLFIPANSTASFSTQGLLGDGITQATLVAPAFGVGQDVTVFVSTRGILNACGGLHPITITTIPPDVQPKRPFRLDLSYQSGDPTGPLATFGLTRFAPQNGACVPQPSQVDQNTMKVESYLEHFSDFQMQQIAPSGTIATGVVFPNPLYLRNQPFFTFSNFPAGAHVKVFTLLGENLYSEDTNASGVASWPATNHAGRQVASGIYLAVVEAGSDKRVFKLAVVR